MTDLSKQQQQEVKKEVGKQLKEAEKDIEEKVEKRLYKKVLDKTKQKTVFFGSEFKKQASTAIITAFGLVIALAWKDVITDFVNRVNPAASNFLISALIVTAISIIGIAIVNQWAKKEEPKSG